MSETARTDLQCPFEELLDRRILGDLSAEERSKLESHVATGCATCVPRYRSEEHLEGLVRGHFSKIEDEIEERRDIVLDRLKDQLEREDDRRQQRRFRRLAMNGLMLLFILGGVVLMATEYLMTAALSKKLVRAQRDAADTEMRAILVGLARYHNEHRALPKDDVELTKALLTVRQDGVYPYYSFEASRLDEQGRLRDPWLRPYVYRADNAGVWLQSLGPNGRDEQGIGDDLLRQLIVK